MGLTWFIEGKIFMIKLLINLYKSKIYNYYGFLMWIWLEPILQLVYHQDIVMLETLQCLMQIMLHKKESMLKVHIMYLCQCLKRLVALVQLLRHCFKMETEFVEQWLMNLVQLLDLVLIFTVVMKKILKLKWEKYNNNKRS